MSDRVPKENFYRRLTEMLDLTFLYQLTEPYYKEEYNRGIARLKTKQGKRFKFIRSSTVEPVFGSLTQFYGMRKINTIGIKQANKVMLMAGTVYNLKKYLKFITKTAKSKVGEVKALVNQFFGALKGKKREFKATEF